MPQFHNLRIFLQGDPVMIKKVIVSILCALLVACMVSCGFLALYFILPSQKSRMSLHLPNTVEDSSEVLAAQAEAQEDEGNITYIPDVNESLTLREKPDSRAAAIASLPLYTHMTIQEEVENSPFVYVLVTTGPFEGYQGYVNSDYIQPLGSDNESEETTE